MQSENQRPVPGFPVFQCGPLAVTPLDQLRLRLPAHECDLLMQAIKPVAEADRDALLKEIAAELGQHEWRDPACCIGSSASSGATGAPKQISHHRPALSHGGAIPTEEGRLAGQESPETWCRPTVSERDRQARCINGAEDGSVAPR